MTALVLLRMGSPVTTNTVVPLFRPHSFLDEKKGSLNKLPFKYI